VTVDVVGKALNLIKIGLVLSVSLPRALGTVIGSEKVGGLIRGNKRMVWRGCHLRLANLYW